FMDDPDVTRALALCLEGGFKFEIMRTSFYLCRRNLVRTPNTGLPAWQERIFMALEGLAIDPSDYFNLPSGVGNSYASIEPARSTTRRCWSWNGI
ncbi:hypothetical protein ACC695_38295, partial [Rhizobium ruizarguesonis]